MFDPMNISALEMVQPSYNFMTTAPPQSAQPAEEESESTVEESQTRTQQSVEAEPNAPSMWQEPVEDPRVSTTEAAYNEGGNADNGRTGAGNSEENVDRLSGGAAAEGTISPDSAAGATVPETENSQAAEAAIPPVSGNSLDIYV